MKDIQASPAQSASPADGDPLRSEESLFLQKARERWKEDKARRIHYTKKFDLDSLPSYRPQQRVSGVIRQWGVNYIADSGLVDQWESGFRIHHPDVTFADHLKSSVLGAPGLYTGLADLAPMGRQLIWDELTAYQRETDSLPLEITFATGSYNVGGWTFALAVMVHKDNPLTQLTIPQLDGIFGTQRAGGWKGLMWDTSVARGPEANIRTWGQLGLGGEWREKPINVYGYNLKFHFPDEFSKKVFGGGDKWNEGLIEYANRAAPDGSTLILAADQFMGGPEPGSLWNCIRRGAVADARDEGRPPGSRRVWPRRRADSRQRPEPHLPAHARRLLLRPARGGWRRRTPSA